MRRGVKSVRLALLLLGLLSLLSCYRQNYSFVGLIEGKERIDFFEQVKGNRVFADKGMIEGVFIETGKTYNFRLDYDLYSERLELKFYSALGDELIFDAEYNSGEMTYNYFQSSFFSVKIGFFLKYFYYFINVALEGAELKLTNDDYYVAIDEKGNYLKYDEARLIKKENRRYLIRYKYEDALLNSIEINDGNKRYFVKFKTK